MAALAGRNGRPHRIAGANERDASISPTPAEPDCGQPTAVAPGPLPFGALSLAEARGNDTPGRHPHSASSEIESGNRLRWRRDDGEVGHHRELDHAAIVDCRADDRRVRIDGKDRAGEPGFEKIVGEHRSNGTRPVAGADQRESPWGANSIEVPGNCPSCPALLLDRDAAANAATTIVRSYLGPYLPSCANSASNAGRALPGCLTALAASTFDGSPTTTSATIPMP
jgi:hypothetical protein